jgi:hypothetical protein
MSEPIHDALAKELAEPTGETPMPAQPAQPAPEPELAETTVPDEQENPTGTAVTDADLSDAPDAEDAPTGPSTLPEATAPVHEFQVTHKMYHPSDPGSWHQYTGPWMGIEHIWAWAERRLHLGSQPDPEQVAAASAAASSSAADET